jgi:subtilisin family serine protease
LVIELVMIERLASSRFGGFTMWHKILTLTIVVTLGLVGSLSAAKLLPGGEGRILGQYIIVLKSGAPGDLARAHNIVPSHVYRHAIRGFSASLPDAALKRLLDDPSVDYIEPDGRVWAVAPGNRPDKGKPPKDDGGTTDPPVANQETPWGISYVGGPQNGVGLTAWVIDTGVDYGHPDLNVDTSRAANFVTRGKNTAEDGHGHGTHVAGTIAAINNSIDVVGVAAGATVVPVRVLSNSGSGYTSWVIAGVDYVAANAGPGDVANMSLGGGVSTSLDTAVSNAAATGVRFALAAGNDSVHAGNSSPARVDHDNVYTVSAIDSNGSFAWFSNYGNPPIDVAAPGVGILSTANGGGTTTMSGTSMAAPHVAGLLLLDSLDTSGTAKNDPDNTADPLAYFY